MGRFANPQALAAGMVCVIDLDTVVQRFGSRWPMRREHVHEHVSSTLDRQLGPTAYHLRISDTDVLICQPDKERLAGQALCLRALREILTHFLGDGEMAEAGVHEVVRISRTVWRRGGSMWPPRQRVANKPTRRAAGPTIPGFSGRGEPMDALRHGLWRRVAGHHPARTRPPAARKARHWPAAYELRGPRAIRPATTRAGTRESSRPQTCCASMSRGC